MKCAEADAFLHAYVDGELAGMDRDTYEQHILRCDRCFRTSRLQARFKAALRGHLPRREVPEGLRRRIAAALVSSPPPPRRWLWQLYPRLFPSTAGAFLLVLVASASIYRGRHSPVLDQALLTYQAAIPMDVINN